MLEQLTSRELQVVENMVWGLSKKEVSDRLNVSYATIDTHVRKVYLKLDVHKISELSAIYFSERYNIVRSVGLSVAMLSMVLKSMCLVGWVGRNIDSKFLASSLFNRAKQPIEQPKSDVNVELPTDLFIKPKEIDGNDY